MALKICTKSTKSTNVGQNQTGVSAAAVNKIQLRRKYLWIKSIDPQSCRIKNASSLLSKNSSGSPEINGIHLNNNICKGAESSRVIKDGKRCCVMQCPTLVDLCLHVNRNESHVCPHTRHAWSKAGEGMTIYADTYRRDTDNRRRLNKHNPQAFNPV